MVQYNSHTGLYETTLYADFSGITFHFKLWFDKDIKTKQDKKVLLKKLHSLEDWLQRHLTGSNMRLSPLTWWSIYSSFVFFRSANTLFLREEINVALISIDIQLLHYEIVNSPFNPFFLIKDTVWEILVCNFFNRVYFYAGCLSQGFFPLKKQEYK